MFEGKRILVTGSTRGIGAATAELFLEQGGDVVIHGRTSDKVAPVVATLAARHPGRVSGQAADLGDVAACATLARAAGAIDVLVNCGGIYEEVPVAETTISLWDRMIAVNVTAPWQLTKALIPALRARHGVVVNVASDAAMLGYAGAVAYCASKGALVGLTRALAVELAPEIRTLCVCPGPTDTPMDP